MRRQTLQEGCLAYTKDRDFWYCIGSWHTSTKPVSLTLEGEIGSLDLRKNKCMLKLNQRLKGELWKWRLTQLGKEKEDPLEMIYEHNSEKAACSAAEQPQEHEREITEIINETEIN